ncbi:hypothetical protein AGOR_G00044240 [Albula goreensis]|uniref:Uncharacterized protein n=1 Tax=Albula goreensis TaxID=1534307 RepID=A0A8T3E444_9TELE|nr:hypothetical protein AGOR_G00044240 [Albula goreensis]
MIDCSFLKEAKSVISLVQGISVIILLQVTEHLMEPHFTCPCNKYRFLFLCLFFIVPAIAFIVFSLFLNEVSTLLVKYFNKSKDRIYRCSLSSLKITGMILYPPLCWLVILLIDGKYVACGWYRKCNSTMTHADMKDPEVLEDITMSKVCGFAVLGLFVILAYPLYLCHEHCCSSPEARYNDMLKEKLEKKKGQFPGEYAETLIEEKAKECKTKLDEERQGNKNPETVEHKRNEEVMELDSISPAVMKVFTPVQNRTMLILLETAERSMEPLFPGPWHSSSFSFTVLAISLKWGKNVLRDCKSRGCSWYKLFQFRVLIYPAVFWVVILLIDGKYLACGLYSKCNGTMTTVDMKDPEMVEKMTISKICGYSLLS